MNAALHLLPDLVWLVPALPLLAAAAVGLRVLCGRARGDGAEPLTARLCALAALAGLLLLLAIDFVAVHYGAPGHRVLGTWFASGNWRGSVSFLLDPLSLAVATVAALIGWLTLRFSANYLHREAGFHRFFIVLSLFLAGIQPSFSPATACSPSSAGKCAASPPSC